MRHNLISLIHARKAVTYIEIMVACVFMLFIFIIGTAISNSFSGVKKVRNYEVAMALANQAIEAVRAARTCDLGGGKLNKLKKGTLASDFSSASDRYDGNLDGFVPVIKIDGIEYKRTITIENIDSMNKDIETGLKSIRVIVSWNAKEDGAPVNFEVFTTHCDLW